MKCVIDEILSSEPSERKSKLGDTPIYEKPYISIDACEKNRDNRIIAKC